MKINLNNSVKDYKSEGNELIVTWSDGHKSKYPFDMLFRKPISSNGKIVLWDKAFKPTPTPYESVIV